MKYILVAPGTEANTNTPNLGLAYLGTALKEQGHDVEIVDLELKPFPLERYLKECDVFGVSVKVNTYYEAQRITRKFKDKFPNTKIIWGGPMVTYNHEQCKKDVPEVDEFYTVMATELIGKEFEDMPIPDYTIFDSINILKNYWSTGKARYPLVSSVGCPYQCIFCSSDKKYRYRTPESCAEELRLAQQNFNIKAFMPMDDNFNMIKDRLIKFCELIQDYKLSWTCTNGLRANTFDEETAIALRQAGCWKISFGIESTDQIVLDTIKKGEKFEQIEKAVQIALKYKFVVNGFFIIGLPGSTFESDMKSLKWARKMGIDYHFNILTPYQGTELYDMYKDNIVSDPFKSLHFSRDLDKLNVSYATDDYPVEKRIEMYKEAWRTK